jgi:hypothetical protein
MPSKPHEIAFFAAFLNSATTPGSSFVSNARGVSYGTCKDDLSSNSQSATCLL